MKRNIVAQFLEGRVKAAPLLRYKQPDSKDTSTDKGKGKGKGPRRRLHGGTPGGEENRAPGTPMRQGQGGAGTAPAELSIVPSCGAGSQSARNCVLDLVSPLLDIVAPPLKPRNLAVLTPAETKSLDSVVDVSCRAGCMLL